MRKLLRHSQVFAKKHNNARFYSTSATAKMTPDQLVAEMKKAGQHRGYIVYDAASKKTQVSHPVLNDLADFVVSDKRDFLNHEGLFLQIGPETGALMGAFIQKSVRGQAQGGVRYWQYNTVEDFVRDGLRLSLGMGRKSALAGLYHGGGKGIICKHPGQPVSNALFNEYGRFLTSLKGAYYGAEDVGLTVNEVAQMYKYTRYVTCIPKELGGSGNPSISTARGTVCGMEGALDFLQMGSLKGKKVVMQGCGNVASFMVEELLKRQVGELVVSDISEKAISKAKDRFAHAKGIIQYKQMPMGDNSVLFEECDVLAPNALGGILNSNTIPNLKTKIVCGAANNQLLDPIADDLALKKRGITYVPDYVNNRMGIVNCANENYGYVLDDPAIQRHFSRDWENSVFVVTQKILKMSQEGNMPTGQAANQLADKMAEVPHPIWPHRGYQIIQSLVKDGWEKQAMPEWKW